MTVADRKSCQQVLFGEPLALLDSEEVTLKIQ